VNKFLFFTRPTENPEQVKANGGIPWCCSKATRSGNRILLYVTGRKEICYKWRAVSDSIPDPTKKYRYVCNVEFVCDFVPPITLTELKETVPEWKPLYNLRGFRAIRIPNHIAEKISVLRPTL
jgi:hypothetical protein